MALPSARRATRGACGRTSARSWPTHLRRRGTTASTRSGRAHPETSLARLELLLRRLAGFLEQPDQRLPPGVGQTDGGPVHLCLVLLVDLGDQRAAVAGQRHDARTSIAVVGFAFDEPRLLEPVDRGRRRPARQVDPAADLVDELRPLVEERLE